jgi:hypothetical protein
MQDRAATPVAGGVTFTHSYNKANQWGGGTSDNTWWNYPL